MESWKALSGSNNWSGLLEPLNEKLSQTLVHYGERVQAMYSAHVDGHPKYEEKEFFSKVGLGMYTMKRYVYASPEFYLLESECAWIGYVAVATDEGKKELGRRDILICFRGTSSDPNVEWINNAKVFHPISASQILGQSAGKDPCVHRGFLSIYMSARDQVLEAVKQCLNQYESEEISITVTGHSVGASLATLNAVDIVSNGYNKYKYKVTVFAFSSTKVGNSDFVSAFNKLDNLHLLHIFHCKDCIPKRPFLPSYSKMGILLSIKCFPGLSIQDVKGDGIVISLTNWYFRFHTLKNLLKAIEMQQGKRGLLFAGAVSDSRHQIQAPAIKGIAQTFLEFEGKPITCLDELDESNLVVEELETNNFKLSLRIPRAQ